MSIRTRIHRPSSRPCIHRVIVKVVGHPGYGRCIDCNVTVVTPFVLG
jgi:hypothetical protein